MYAKNVLQGVGKPLKVSVLQYRSRRYGTAHTGAILCVARRERLYRREATGLLAQVECH